jgi:hypothetical protein
MRGFVIGLVMFVFLTLTALSFRPGGLQAQLHFAARRFRIALVLGGIYLIVTGVIRIAFPDGVVADWGPPLFAVALVILFAVLGQDPARPPHEKDRATRR